MNNFEIFLKNIRHQNKEEMLKSAQEIAKKLNKKYYNLEQDGKSHLYIVGSVGRGTSIKGSSDLDIIFDLPKEIFKRYDKYSVNGQSALLQEIRSELKDRYTKTEIVGDGQVVVLDFYNYKIELVCGFKTNNNSFKYPDSNNGGSWKETKPLKEIEFCRSMNICTSGHYTNFCNILRAWKNNKGVKFPGLLIDTCVYYFLIYRKDLHCISFSTYHYYLTELFCYISKLNKEQSYWYALGSNQKIYNKTNGQFIKKATYTFEQLSKINSEKDLNIFCKKEFGLYFPRENNNLACKGLNSEMFIEELFDIDISYEIKIDCIVEQKGFRPISLIDSIRNNKFVKKDRKLIFKLINECIDKPYDTYWKIKNYGEEAIKANCLRGEILKDNSNQHIENTLYKGEHYIECFVVKNNICVARFKLEVPIF